MLPADDATSLALLYHLNSEPWLNFDAYGDPLNTMQFKKMGEADQTRALPAPGSDTPLRALIRERRSCREFEARTLPLATLADILANGCGISGIIENPGGNKSWARPFPSGGGLYPLEVYVALQAVDSIPDGLYHYNALDHSLEQMQLGPALRELGERLLGQRFLDRANVAVLFSAVFERTLRKYGPRGYRYILLEAGHAAQNVCLLAAESGLNSLCLGGFHDHRLNRYLRLDGRSEAVVYTVGLGFRAES